MSPARTEDEGVESDTDDASGGEQNIGGDENDNIEGWVDETRLLMNAEHAVLEEQAQRSKYSFRCSENEKIGWS